MSDGTDELSDEDYLKSLRIHGWWKAADELVSLRSKLDLTEKAFAAARQVAHEYEDKLEALCDVEVQLGNVVAERDAALLRLESYLALLHDVATSGVSFQDERVSYVEVQIDADTWAKLQQFVESSEKDRTSENSEVSATDEKGRPMTYWGGEVERQKRESGPASGYPEDFDNKWD